jgi:hypothetical protein
VGAEVTVSVQDHRPLESEGLKSPFLTGDLFTLPAGLPGLVFPEDDFVAAVE